MFLYLDAIFKLLFGPSNEGSSPQDGRGQISDAALRKITVLMFIPGVALLIPHSVLLGRACPGLGLIPLLFGAVFGLMHLKYGTRNHRSNRAAIVDVCLSIFLIGVLIPDWMYIARDRSWSSKLVGAYAMLPMLINFCIHASFALREMSKETRHAIASRELQRSAEADLRSTQCPHCKGTIPPVYQDWCGSNNFANTVVYPDPRKNGAEADKMNSHFDGPSLAAIEPDNKNDMMKSETEASDEKMLA